MGGTPVRFSDPDIKLGDMNGDGLVDIVRDSQGRYSLLARPRQRLLGHGRARRLPGGTFGQGRDITMTASPQYSDIQGDSLRLDDVNGDGLDDLVQVRFDAVDVWLNVDGAGWTPNRHIISRHARRARHTRTAFAWSTSTARARATSCGATGAATSTSICRAARGLGADPRRQRARQDDRRRIQHVDRSRCSRREAAGSAVAVEGADAAARRDARHRERQPRDRRPARRACTSPSTRTATRSTTDGSASFAASRRRAAKRVGDDNSPTATTRVDVPARRVQGRETTADGVGRVRAREPWRDNPREALKGLPTLARRSTRAASTSRRCTTRIGCDELYAGSTGARCAHAFESAHGHVPLRHRAVRARERERRRSPTSSSSARSGTVDAGRSGSVTLRSGGGPRAHAVDRRRRSVRQRDGASRRGLRRRLRRAADEVITASTCPAVPTGDTGGWLWRTVESYVTGASGDKLHRNLVTYDAQGDPTLTQVDLAGSLPLGRANVLAGQASTDGIIPTLVQEYDELGNVTGQFGANGRCRHMDQDTAFAELAVGETVFAGPGPTSRQARCRAGHSAAARCSRRPPRTTVVSVQ